MREKWKKKRSRRLRRKRRKMRARSSAFLKTVLDFFRDTHSLLLQSKMFIRLLGCTFEMSGFAPIKMTGGRVSIYALIHSLSRYFFELPSRLVARYTPGSRSVAPLPTRHLCWSSLLGIQARLLYCFVDLAMNRYDFALYNNQSCDRGELSKYC